MATLYFHVPVVRRRLRRDALAAWTQAETVLFVCLGNICRSPFAEVLARMAVADEKVVRSAGILQRHGRQAPQHAIDRARRWGVDLSAHRSRVLTPELVEEADAVFVFDHSNYRGVVSAYPAARGKVYYIGALAHRGPVLIGDPFGRSAGEFDNTYRLIAQSVHGAATRVGGGRGRPASSV